jgi:hypothetical protein
MARIAGAQTDDRRVAALEAQLAATNQRVAEMQSVIRTLVEQVAALRDKRAAPAAASYVENARTTAPAPEETFADQILVRDLGHDERDHVLDARPELFIQSRYTAIPIEGATGDDVTANFGLSRMELRWAGRVSDKVGIGYEIQFHPAPDGASEELVNDAYVEYYANEAITIKAGQFVKPFGFDIQHSSSARESPERGIYAGYFFPGQRDRGVLISAKLDTTADWLRGTTLQTGVFNGNRFFNDNNRQVNYNLRFRKVLDSVPLALGASLQLGNQVLPPGVEGDNNENVFGLDAQFVVGRLGVRGEFMSGNTPSTLLGLGADFSPSFRPGGRSSGLAVLADYYLTDRDQVYGRYDQFLRDPVGGADIRAFNFGYLRKAGPNSRIGVDYQFKNGVTYNDDELNTRLSVNWNVWF